MKSSALAMLLAAGLTGLCDGDPAAPQDPQDPIVTRFTELTNAARASQGCEPLAWHEGAATVARLHSRDMASRAYFSHTNPDGRDPFERLAAAGVKYVLAAENILHGEASATRALDLWLKSPGHRSNLLDCSFTHHGVGRVDTYWTHIFLRDPS